MAADRVPSAAELAGSVLVVETSNEMPGAQEVSEPLTTTGPLCILLVDRIARHPKGRHRRP